MVITTRKFNPDSDTGIIVTTMSKSIYYDSHPKKGRPNQKWFTAFHEYLTAMLPTASIVMAIAEDDPDFLLGYIICVGSQLEFIYVKDGYLNQGIATMLSNELPWSEVNKNNLTKIGKIILEQKEASVKTQPESTSDKKLPAIMDDWIDMGFLVRCATFHDAITAAHNTAESQLSMDSNNKQRRPDSMHYTPYGLIVKQNNNIIIVPLSNIHSTSVEKIASA